MRAVSLLTTGAQPPESNCQAFNREYSEFDRCREISPCRYLPVLYPSREHLTLTQKLFRREPASTRFDQLFTPYHKSSDSFERLNGSGLLLDFSKIHPAHGKLTWLRVLCALLFFALLTLGFPLAPPHKGLACSAHKLVGSFFNRHAVTPHLD